MFPVNELGEYTHWPVHDEPMQEPVKVRYYRNAMMSPWFLVRRDQGYDTGIDALTELNRIAEERDFLLRELKESLHENAELRKQLEAKG